MTTSPSNALSPSSSIYSSSTAGSSMGRSPSNRSLYRDLTSATSNNNITSLANGNGGGGWKSALGRSRQNTTDFMTGEDLVRTIGSDYQEIQKRTLTKWVNSQLETVDDHIINIETDFKDGRKLLKLLSVVSNDPAPKPEKMNMRIHQLANVAQALSFLEKHLGADSIVDMGNEAIVNGDKKKTLALIFFIMIKYQIQVVLNDHGDDFAQSLLTYSDRRRDGLHTDVLSTGEPTTNTNGSMIHPTDKGAILTTPTPGTNSLVSAKKLGSNYSINSDKQHTTSSESKLALLFWVRIQLEDYIAASIIPSIQDFSRSWRNGLAFCLLIHRHGSDLLPDLFSYHLKDADLSQKQTWRRLLTLAFDLAMEHMDIPRYLEPEDLCDVDYPHEPSVMMYVAEFYKVMSRAQQKVSDDERHDIAIRRRTNIAMVTGGIDSHISDDELLPLTDQHHLDNDTTNNDSDQRKINRKKAHRRSTLTDDDKKRIKADLNSRLMMQLTGHLPRGVHPVLDQLITIHETVLATIKTNTRTIDEIPTSFDDADTVAEYLDALEVVERQIQQDSTLLDTARDAKEELMLPPENADDTLIRLTDLQRTQVKNLYDMLLTQWTDFEQLVSTTKVDLLRIESDLTDIEEGTKKYHAEADKVMARIQEIQHLLDQVAPRHASNFGDIKAGDLWHPLDETNQDGQIEEISLSYRQAALVANEQVNEFDSTMWKSYRRFILQFSRAVLKQVKSRLNELEQDHQLVMDMNRNILSSSEEFSCGMNLISTTKDIGLELESIRTMMDNNNYTTNDRISGLESQVNAVRTKIHKTRESYDGLLIKDDRLGAFVDKVQQQYEMVRDWVDQVRVWFVEAERIRKWIEIRIDIIKQRNESFDFDPLSDTLTEEIRSGSEKWRDEHAKLARDIDRFNNDDMARLRSHVKSLTGTDRGDSDLSPADASTIEITLTTLNMLNQLMVLLHKRSSLVDMLMLRIQWDDLCGACSRWILDTDQEMDDFLKPGLARWICSDDDIENGANDVASLDSNGNTSRRRFPGRTPSSSKSLMDTEEMIQTLVTLESKVTEYNLSQYTQCLDAFQEMEDLHDTALPAYLNTQQTQFEDSFGDLMKRSGFTRKVVEQHLSLLDITTQYRQLRDEGELLRVSMVNATKSTSTRTKATGNEDDDNDDSDSDIYGEKVQDFKEKSSQLITSVFSKIMYTDVPAYTTMVVGSHDQESNDQANQLIKETIQGYSMQLATIAEALENLLASNRRTLSLQQRATLAYEEMMRLVQWMDDRAQKYKKSWLNKADYGGDSDDDNDDNEDDSNVLPMEYQRELDGMMIRMEQLDEGELSRLRMRVSAIEDDIDASNTSTIDRGALINAIELLDDTYSRLRQLLERRALDLAIMDKHKLWDEQIAIAEDAVNDVARNLWTFVGLARMQIDGDVDNGGGTSSTLDQEQLSIEAIQDMPALCQNGCYSDLENAYLQLGTYSSLPGHLKAKQEAIVAKYHDLEKLYLYVLESLEHKTNLESLVAEIDKATQQGNSLYETFVKLYIPGSPNPLLASPKDNDDASTASGSNEHDDDLFKFKQLVESLSGKWVEIETPENLSTMFDSERVIQTSDDESAAQVNKLVKSKLDNLQCLVKSMEQTKAHYFDVLKTKESLLQYETEANGQLEWIEKHLTLLKSSSVDISDTSLVVTEELVGKHNQELLRLSDDINTFKEHNVNALKEHVKNLRATKHGDMDTHSTDGSDATLEIIIHQIDNGMTQLYQLVSMELQTLEMTRQYISWIDQLEQLANNISNIQEQLHPLVFEVKEKSIEDDLSIVDLDLLEGKCGFIETQTKSVGQVMKTIRIQFIDNLSPFIKKQLKPSSANTACDRLESRLVGVERSFDRCQNTLRTKAQEIGSLKEQQNWQHQANNALNKLGDLSEEIDYFVENKARWQPGTVISENGESDLRSGWAEIKEKLNCHHRDTIQPLRQKIETWATTKQDDFNGAVKWSENVIRALLDAHGNVEQTLVFTNDIISQRCLMATFLGRTSQLESSAGMLREEFLAHELCDSDIDKTKQSTGEINWLANLAGKLQQFDIDIGDIRQNLATTIPLPVRNPPSLSTSSILVDCQKSSLHSSIRNMPAVKDETTNAIIRGTIDTRIQRLQELSNGLQSLLDTKERISRCDMSRVLYLRQLETCETWIEASTTKLQNAIKVLNYGTGNDWEGQDSTTNIQQLRGAIGIAGSIEAATCGDDTILAVLESAFNTYKLDLSGVNRDMDGESLDYFDQMGQKWQNLRDEAIQSTKILLGALGPAEVDSHIKHLQQTVHELQAEIDGTGLTLLSDDDIMEWQKQIDALDKNNYHAIVRMMATLDCTNMDEVLASHYDRRIQQQYLDEVGDTILSTRNTLSRLYDIVNLNRLCNTFKENANLVKGMIDEAQTALLEILKTHEHMADGMDFENYHDALVDANEEAKQKIADCKETYDDLCDFSSFIETQKTDGNDSDDLLSEVYATQDNINNDWKLLQTHGQSIFNLVTLASRLVQGYDRLGKVEQSVLATRTGLNCISHSPSKDAIVALEKKLRDDTSIYMDESRDLLESLDGEYETKFGARYKQMATMISDLQQLLRQHKQELERNKVMHCLSVEVARIQNICEEQLKFIRQQILANPDLVGKRPESIQHISQTYVAAIGSIEKVYEKCKDDYKVVLDQGKRLTDYYGVPSSQVETIKRPLDKALDDLETTTQIENEYIGALRFVIKNVKTEVELTRSLSTMKATLSKYSKHNLRSRIHSLPDLAEFNRRYDDLTKSVQQFFSMGDDLKKAKLYKRIGVARTSTVNKAVDHCQDIIRRMWGEVKVIMDETKTRLEDMYRRQHGISTLNETLRYVDNIKDRINSLQLSGKSVTVEENELEELDKEIKVTLAQKIQEMDILLASISDSDGVIRKQRAQLSTATDQLHHLIHVRQEQAQTAGNITLFLGFIDQVDEQILEILVAVENSAPHHAKVIHGKFVKTDLQDLLRRLVTVYKKNSPQISKLLGSAKEEARKQFLDDNSRVAKRLEKTMDRWIKAQASASAREKELHTCIDALNHEFFTKLAMAKTKKSTPSNTANSNRRPSYSKRRPSVSRTESPPLPPPSTFSGLPPPSAYTTTRRTSFQTSTLAVDQRTVANSSRKSKTPTSTPGKQRTTYVSDPKNELDVQLGRIVNDSEVKVSIKMVSGEVGKYYFGERLAYCRILPSKMVMVRVGGGWVELSHFLKDHSHSDSNSNKQNYSNSNNLTTSPQDQNEDMPQTNNTPSRRPSINNSSLDPNHSQSKSSNRSKSPVSSGYMEGDTFIHVGEDGKQVVMKLTKAKEDATTPIKRYS